MYKVFSRYEPFFYAASLVARVIIIRGRFYNVFFLRSFDKNLSENFFARNLCTHFTFWRAIKKMALFIEPGLLPYIETVEPDPTTCGAVFGLKKPNAITQA